MTQPALARRINKIRLYLIEAFQFVLYIISSATMKHIDVLFVHYVGSQLRFSTYE